MQPTSGSPYFPAGSSDAYERMNQTVPCDDGGDHEFDEHDVCACGFKRRRCEWAGCTRFVTDEECCTEHIAEGLQDDAWEAFVRGDLAGLDQAMLELTKLGVTGNLIAEVK